MILNNDSMRMSEDEIVDEEEMSEVKDRIVDEEEMSENEIVNEEEMSEVKDEIVDEEEMSEVKDEIVDEEEMSEVKDEIVDEAKDETVKIGPLKKKQIPRDQISVTRYFEKYIKNIDDKKPKEAISNFVSMMTTVNKNPDLFKMVVDFFKNHKAVLSEKIALQGIGEVNHELVLKTELFYLMIKMAVNNEKIKLNFDVMNTIIKNDKLLIEYKKYYNRINKK